MSILEKKKDKAKMMPGTNFMKCTINIPSKTHSYSAQGLRNTKLKVINMKRANVGDVCKSTSLIKNKKKKQ